MKRLLTILLLLPTIVFGQLSEEDQLAIDSLKVVVEQAKHDSIRINAWVEWDKLIYLSDPQLDREINENIITLCDENLGTELAEKEEVFFLRSKGVALNILGLLHKSKGDFANAIDSYNGSLEIMRKIDDQRGIANSLNNMGSVYREFGDYSTALEYHTNSQEIHKSIGNKMGVANSYDNIGSLYEAQGNLDESIKYHLKSLELKKEIGNENSIAHSLNNLGDIYSAMGDHKKAKEYCLESLEIHQKFGEKKAVASAYYNLGQIVYRQGDMTAALDYFSKGLAIRKELSDKTGIAEALIELGRVSQKNDDCSQAISYNRQALKISDSIGALPLMRDASKILYECYEKQGDASASLSMLKVYMETRDTLERKSNQDQLMRQEYKLEFEKKEAIQKAEGEKLKLEAQQQERLSYILYTGLALALVFAGIVFNRFRVTSKQKVVIEQKNTEILDSIKYAKRIQSAVLPSNSVVKELLPDSFVLYKPKDIVAGDFYWCERKDNTTIFAVADCTGHGVPGAMVSVVCNNGLNRSVREHNLMDPGKILDKTREIVVQEFEKSDEEVRDGMDIALCTVSGNTLHYAGAHNPLWIIRNGELIEFKADRQAIGNTYDVQPFNTHQFELASGDTLYLFSDGFADQFGGEKGKKFRSGAFKKLLLSIQNETMENQKTFIDEAFENWRGQEEQIDDVCVMGVKF